MPRLPNSQSAPRRQARPWRLLAIAAVVTVGTIGLGAALVEPAPGRIVATDDDQVPELTGARPVSAGGPAPQDVVEGVHLHPRPEPAPSPRRTDSPREEPSAPDPTLEAEPQAVAPTRRPSPQLTTRPDPAPAPSPSAVAPTPPPASETPQPSPEPDPEPSKPSWWPW